ncbi:MAG: hypothetical protein IK141_07730 [Clostridia bacterium]|nr:hypothetical protein [Clostridia bacterium]
MAAASSVKMEDIVILTRCCAKVNADFLLPQFFRCRSAIQAGQWKRKRKDAASSVIVEFLHSNESKEAASFRKRKGAWREHFPCNGMRHGIQPKREYLQQIFA